MRRSLNTIGTLALLLCLPLLMAGCGDGGPEASEVAVDYDPAKDPNVNPAKAFEQPPEDRGEIDTDQTLYFHLGGSPNTLNPLFASSLYEFIVINTLYDSPFAFDQDFLWFVDETVVEHFEESEDFRTVTIKLNPDLKWHDGHPVTADDFVFSWQQILSDEVPSFTHKPGTDKITDVVAVDEHTVRFVQDDPTATRLWNLLYPVVPKHIFEKGKEENPDLKTGEYYNNQSRNPVGWGPYKIVEWVENDKIVLERWEDYHGDKPYFKRVVFKIIPDATVALLSFEKGDVDYLRALSSQQFAVETQRDSFTEMGYKVWSPEWAFSYIGWNMDGSNPFFADKRVRYAMTHAMNRPLIKEKISYNLTTYCEGIYHPDSWMFNPDIEMLTYDLDKAAALLDEAGWTVDPDSGWRTKEIDGKEVEFEFTLTFSQGNPTAVKIASIFQQDLKKLGVRMKTQVIEWSVFLEKARNHEFQAQMAGWGTGTDPDTGWNLWRSDQYEQGRNYVGYSNETVDKLFEEGRKEFDFEKRKLVYQKIHKEIYDDQPYTWLFNSPARSAINHRIQGIIFSPRGVTGFWPGMRSWWVAKQEAAVAAP